RHEEDAQGRPPGDRRHGRGQSDGKRFPHRRKSARRGRGRSRLAHGDLYMLGGYAAVTLLGWGAGYWSALVLVPILVGAVGWALEELGIRPLLPRADRAIVTLLLTFGVSLILRDIAQVAWGTETRAVAPPFTGIVSFAEVFVPTYRLFVFGIALIAIFAT